MPDARCQMPDYSLMTPPKENFFSFYSFFVPVCGATFSDTIGNQTLYADNGDSVLYLMGAPPFLRASPFIHQVIHQVIHQALSHYELWVIVLFLAGGKRLSKGARFWSKLQNPVE
ncbi:MAG: hypothetical protein LBJ36_04510 [Synergistaceae bacterium]|jgi:hypothetical protein|nr:hypothetical protein [Synergistaceae bacterium]